MALPAFSLNDILLATFDSVQCKAANEDVWLWWERILFLSSLMQMETVHFKVKIYLLINLIVYMDGIRTTLLEILFLQIRNDNQPNGGIESIGS